MDFSLVHGLFRIFPFLFIKKGRWELEILQCQGYTYSSVIATHKCPRMIFRTPLCRLEYTWLKFFVSFSVRLSLEPRWINRTRILHFWWYLYTVPKPRRSRMDQMQQLDTKPQKYSCYCSRRDRLGFYADNQITVFVGQCGKAIPLTQCRESDHSIFGTVWKRYSPGTMRSLPLSCGRFKPDYFFAVIGAQKSCLSWETMYCILMEWWVQVWQCLSILLVRTGTFF